MEIKEILAEVASESSNHQIEELTPREIVSRLDEYIVGQQNAKKAVAVALRNRMRRRKLPEEIREEVYPKNIIMIGPTGVGKTEIARRLSKLCGAPFLKVEATKYTEVGYVGRDVESMIRDLATISLNLVKNEYRENVKGTASFKAEESILDLILPPIFTKKEEELNQEEKERNTSYKQSRERFREMLREGKLDDQEIEIDLPKPAAPTGMPMLQVFGAGNMEDMDNQLQNLLGDIMPKKQGKRKVKVSEAKKIVVEVEAEKLIDNDKIQSEAVRRAENMGIIFLDEIDKIAGERKSSRSRCFQRRCPKRFASDRRRFNGIYENRPTKDGSYIIYCGRRVPHVKTFGFDTRIARKVPHSSGTRNSLERRFCQDIVYSKIFAHQTI
jgi:ATP-dependent HslUV protease ATP-binding subunit HslU